MKTSKLIHFGVLATSIFAMSCQSDFLDEKPNSNLVVPNTLADFERLLDNFGVINMAPILGEVSSDDYFFPDEGTLNIMPIYIRKAYLWQPDIYEGQGQVPDWDNSYKTVLVANIVLEGLERLERTDSNADNWEMIRGWALFVRSFTLFNLVQLFGPPYDAATAESDLGVPVRLQPGVDELSPRSSVGDTYARVIGDLEEAAELLPLPLFNPNRNRPNRAAAFALLARVHLSMGNYEKALASANRSLEINNELMDFNDLEVTPQRPFSNLNPEVLVQYQTFNYGMFTYNSEFTLPDEALLALYSDDDLRKAHFFDVTKEVPSIKGSYAINGTPFFGLTTSEVYLTKAECLARKGNVDESVEWLNFLLAKRYIHGTEPFITATKQDDLLQIIFNERRKELVFRGIRWLDIRRLNLEGHEIRLERSIGGQRYVLEPNSPSSTLPIPPDEVRLNDLMHQQ